MEAEPHEMGLGSTALNRWVHEDVRRKRIEPPTFKKVGLK
jgi:hypothetical protein